MILFRIKFLPTATLIALIVSLNCGCQQLTCWMPCWDLRLPWKRSNIVEPTPAPVPKYSVFASPSFRSNPPKRVVMLPSGRSPGSYETNRRAIRELATQLRQVGAFEIVVPPDDKFRNHSDNLLEGAFDEREVAQFARYYNADAIAIVRVNDLRTVVPLRTSITMVIVDAYESVVTFAAEGVWDVADHGTNQAFQSYLYDHQATTVLTESSSEDLPPVELQSPRALFSFAGSQVAEAVRATIR